MNSYSTPALSAGAMAAVRILTLMLGPYLIGSGYVNADNVDGVITALVTIGVAGYGLIKTFTRQKKINAAEQALGQPAAALLKR